MPKPNNYSHIKSYEHKITTLKVRHAGKDLLRCCLVRVPTNSSSDCGLCLSSGQQKQQKAAERVEEVQVRPVIDGRPVTAVQGELIGDALSVISLKQLEDDDDPDRVGKRHSYRSLQQPDISHLDWVSGSSNKEEVCLYHSTGDSKQYYARYRISDKGGGRSYGMGDGGGGQNHRTRESPSGVQGRSPVVGLGTKSPEAEEFLK